MARAQESITINRPIEAVYAYVADAHARPDWPAAPLRSRMRRQDR
ncbi:MAG TPA: hypothetical protein VHB98_13635 [Chloroflexota bacterium]|nr:hypothetical protein [Chloroflexota bacterium]